MKPTLDKVYLLTDKNGAVVRAYRQSDSAQRDAADRNEEKYRLGQPYSVVAVNLHEKY